MSKEGPSISIAGSHRMNEIRLGLKGRKCDQCGMFSFGDRPLSCKHAQGSQSPESVKSSESDDGVPLVLVVGADVKK